jgi:hypothetical protein
MKLILLALISLSMTACNDGGGASAVPAAAAPNVIAPVTPVPSVIDPTPTPSPTPSAQSASVTVYSITQTKAPLQPYPSKTITVTGSCLVYLTKTYCFDDGLKTISAGPGFNPANWTTYGYTFWGVGQAGGMANSQTCWGGCVTDSMSQPTEVTVDQSNLMQTQEIETGVTMSDVFSSGTAAQVNCTDDGTTLDCGTFQVTL